MDKKDFNFFNFVYKIIRFILLMPINTIKYFCIGFYYINFVCIDIAMYTIIFISFGFYKIVKYFILSFTFPIMVFNVLRRRHKIRTELRIKKSMAEAEDKIFGDNSDVILIDEPKNTIIDTNYDVVYIDDMIAQDNAKRALLEKASTPFGDNPDVILIDEPKNTIIDTNYDVVDIDDMIAQENAKKELFEKANTPVDVLEIIEEPSQPEFIELQPQILATFEEKPKVADSIAETIEEKPITVKTPRPNYLAIAFKSIANMLWSGVLVTAYSIYKLFKYLVLGIGATLLAVKNGFVYGANAVYKIVKYLIFGVGMTLLLVWRGITYCSYAVYLPFKYFVYGIIYVLIFFKNVFVYVSFGFYKLVKYLVLSLTLPMMIINATQRRYDANSEIREDARLRKQEAKFKKQLERQKKQEEKLRASLEKKQKDEYVNENVKLEKKSLGEQFNDLLNKIFAFPANLVKKIKETYHNSVFAKNSRNQRDMSRQALLIDFEGEDAEKSDVKLVYQYTAKNTDGKIVTDYMEAFSKVEVHSFLLSEGYEVYNIKTNKLIQLLHSGASTSKVKVKNKDLIFFLNQLSTYIKAGIPLVESLKILARQYSKQKNYQKLFRTLIYDLSMGESFSSALSKQGEAFPRILINMVKASEMTGELPEVLDDMADYFTEMDKTRKQMVTALMYPIIILVISIVVIAFILLFVIPKFVSIYESMDAAQIPGFTLAILALSEFLKHNIFYLIIGICVFIIIIMYLYKNVKVFRTLCQWLMMHMPIFGNVIIYNEVTTFTKTFASLLAHNVFITDSMEILNRVTNNEIYKMLILDTITNLAKGEKISASFKDHWAFPVPAYEMLVTGERTGQLPEMMAKVSAYYQELHRNSVTRIKTFIEPILILFLTVVVGIIVLAIVVPMFGLYQSVQNYG